MRWRTAKKTLHKEPVTHQSLYAVAPFSKRMKAFVVDSFMLLMPILYVVFYFVFGSRESFAEHMGTGWILILASYGVITIVFLHYKAQTPGYKAYDLELKELSTLQNPSLLRLTLRYALMLLCALTLIGLFLPLFRKDKLGIYDLLTHTAPLCK